MHKYTVPYDYNISWDSKVIVEAMKLWNFLFYDLFML